jgi:Tol biopolymer transport system component
MGETFPDTASSAKPPEDRLDSWKEIAAYLNRDVTTVQRWEKREGMPVHRHVHDKMGSVYASRAELDAWARGRNLSTAIENGNHAPSPSPAALPSRSAISTYISRRTIVLPLTAVIAALAIGILFWLHKTEYFWRNPIAGARFQAVTDFDGVAEAAAVSRDGHFVAFLSDRDGQMDVWVTQAGSGEFHNLTRGGATELVNPSVRTLGFSPDGSLVAFWVRKQGKSSGGDISIWAVPTLGGQPRPYLEGVAEFDWSHDGSRLVYHTPGPGDPLFVSDGSVRSENRPIFTAPPGLHCHFPLWSTDATFIYVVQGSLPDKLDIWRISPIGGSLERITRHSDVSGQRSRRFGAVAV